MFKTKFNELMKYVKRNKIKLFLSITIYVLVILFFTYPTPYEILLPGGVQKANRIVDIENSYKQEGTFYTSYVSVVTKPSSYRYLLAKLNKGADIEQLGEYNKQLPIKEINQSSQIDKKSSIYTSLIVAYRKAGHFIDYEESGVIISYRLPGFKSFDKIRVGDVITSVNNVKTTNRKTFSSIIENIDCQSDIKLSILRDNKKMEIITRKTNVEGVCKLGVSVYNYYTNFQSDPKFDIVDDSGYGSSAGLIQTLYIYNAITPQDITHGLKIAGTGVIDEDGNVLPIAGIKQKVFGAIESNVDIYFAPNIVDPQGNNLYMQALEAKAIKKSSIKIVPVKTFDDALQYLQEYKK